MSGVCRALLALIAGLAMTCAAQAGAMDRAKLERLFPSPLIIGERDAQLPVWPVFKQDATARPLVGYLFESIDLAPIPGFSGTPFNLLVAIDAKGVFLDVRVLSQHEPVFVDGLGEAPLHRFVAQYKGLSLQQNIRIGGRPEHAEARGAATVHLDGVAKATASVRIVNQSLLAAALQVARARLGYAAGRDPELVARVRRDNFEALDWAGLQRAGLIQRVRITRAQVEREFAGSGVEGSATAGADESFAHLYVTYLNAPIVGRNLLAEAGWQHLLGRLDDGDHALLVIAAGSERGAYSFVGEQWVRGAVPELLTLRQQQLPIEMRDMDLDDELRLPAELRRADAKVFRVIGPAGLDPALPLDFALRVARDKGQILAERVAREFPVPYRLPDSMVLAAADDDKGWVGVWRARAWELALIGVALAVLPALLAQQRWLAADARRLARVRTAFAAFTLLFIGWTAQGQLSIVNLVAPLQALRAGRGLGFMLHDPVSVLLWAFVAVSLVVWGRGSFCGWLCPFGALQELVWRAGRALRVPRWQPHRRIDARLKWIKYVLLAVVLGCAWVAPQWSDRVVEVEPFKTAITLGFVRDWPYVAWAALLVLASAILYKGYCRYLCPLGAGLALLGRVRLLRWIARRDECGTPCQTCRHRCDYQAIRPDGGVVYEECFQCLDCVAIHASDRRCAPLIAHRQGRVILLRSIVVAARGAGQGA